MEAFSLLRYWRSNAANGNADVRTSTASATATATATATTATTIVTAVSTQTSETGDDEDDDNDHGPFFDLEFSLPAEGEEEGGGGGGDEHVKDGENGNGVEFDEEDSDGSDELEDERELKFTLLSGSSGDSTTDANVSVSPSDDLFFKGSFVPVDQTTDINSKPPQFRVSLMKSATKFRVMMLKFKKSKNAESVEGTESNASGSSNSKDEQKKYDDGEKAEQKEETEDSGKSMTVKFKVEEVPIVSLFKRHNSSKAPKKRENSDESVSASSEEKKFSKEAMQRYLRKVKPLYVRVSKRYGEKLKFSGQLSLQGATKPNIAPSPATEEQKQSPAANLKREKESNPEVSEPPLLPSNAKGLKQGNLPAGLRVVCKHLGKSRSASTAVAASPPGTISANRRDDSLLQQQDGIQSAILHCKRSFKASRDSDCSSRSSSSPAAQYAKCVNSWSSDETEKGGQKAGI